MSKKRKIILFVVLAVIIVVMMVYSMNKKSSKGIEVTVSEVERGDITKIVSGSGYIQPELDVDIAARISAEIIKIHIKEGDRVDRGQLLVELDRQRYEALVEQAESQVMSAQASLKKAEADYTRTFDLYQKQLATQADLDAVEAQKLLSQSQVKQAEAYLRQARDDLAKTRLIAPIAGTVTKLFKEEGEMAVGSEFQSDPIMTVADLKRMEMLSEIDENDVVLVEIGHTAEIEVDAIPDTLFQGIVSEIAHTATTRGMGTQEQVTNFEVKIAVMTPDEKLRPGMSSTVDIKTLTHEDVIYVPIQCVTVRDVKKDSAKTENDGEVKEDSTSAESEAKQNQKKLKGADEDDKEEVVFVIEDNVAKMVPVETGISDDTNIEILSGLEDRQSVVSGSYKALSTELKDGSTVKIKKSLGEKEENKSE
jgi:HlyD family secretion protein